MGGREHHRDRVDQAIRVGNEGQADRDPRRSPRRAELAPGTRPAPRPRRTSPPAQPRATGPSPHTGSLARRRPSQSSRLAVEPEPTGATSPSTRQPRARADDLRAGDRARTASRLLRAAVCLRRRAPVIELGASADVRPDAQAERPDAQDDGRAQDAPPDAFAAVRRALAPTTFAVTDPFATHVPARPTPEAAEIERRDPGSGDR